MGWTSSIVGGLILTIILLSVAVGFTGYLVGTGQSCPTPTSSSTATSQRFGSAGNTTATTNSTSGNGSALAPVPAVADDLVLSPLADLSLAPANSDAVKDLSNSTFWQEVRASGLQTYEELVPQTVIGFYNSSLEWRAWALQNLPGYSAWLDGGFVGQAQGQVALLDPFSSGRNESSGAVEQGIHGFAASVAGVSLASLDFVTFNGLTGLNTLFETGGGLEAACQTLPGQLAQLYESSFEAGVPRGERADYLGRALAITSVMLLVGGAEGFADHFEGALDGVGLADSWATVKPYLGDIAAKVSESAATAAFGILQTLAQRFPQDSAFVTGFTADRMDSMVDVLEKKGVSDGQIQSDIGQIAQVAGTSSDDEAAGEAADVDSLQQGGWLQVSVRSENKMVLYEDSSGDTVTIRGTFLQQVIPGFNPRGPDFVQIHYQEAGVTVYHYYPEKVPAGAAYSPASTNWLPVVPESVASNGDVILVSFELLTPERFAESIPAIMYDDVAGASFVTDFSEITGFQLSGNQISMDVEQEPLEGVWNFVVTGQAMPLTNVGGDTFVEFTLADAVNSPETLKITYDGYGEPLLSIQSGRNFNPVTLVSSDGVKLKFVYNSGGSSVATATDYLQPPSVIWTLGGISEESLDFAVPGASKTFVISEVTPVRSLEWEMVNAGGTYDLGTVGAEIAYTVAQQDFGIQNIQLNEPSQGGADLVSGDGTVTIQARMLANPRALSPANLEATLSEQMNGLVGQVHYDFSENSKFVMGYVILSYLDPTTKTIITLVAVVPKP